MAILRNTLENIYPKQKDTQVAMKTEKYFRKLNKRIKPFALFTNSSIIWILLPLSISLSNFLIKGHIDMQLPYSLSYPWDPHSSKINFILTYLIQAWESVFSGVIIGNVEMLLFGILTQCWMHLDFISRRIESFRPSCVEDNDIQFIISIVKHHKKTLDVIRNVNQCFAVPILSNVVLSSVCLATFAIQLLVLDFKMILPLISCLGIFVGQLWLLCYFGNEIYESSERISSACYNHPWYIAGPRYRKCILILMIRSQKTAVIQPLTFEPANRELFMSLVMNSYRLYCALSNFLDQ
ncbi:GPROR8.2 family protein [Megaselia abdita]